MVLLICFFNPSSGIGIHLLFCSAHFLRTVFSGKGPHTGHLFGRTHTWSPVSFPHRVALLLVRKGSDLVLAVCMFPNMILLGIQSNQKYIHVFFVEFTKRKSKDNRHNNACAGQLFVGLCHEFWSSQLIVLVYAFIQCVNNSENKFQCFKCFNLFLIWLRFLYFALCFVQRRARERRQRIPHLPPVQIKETQSWNNKVFGKYDTGISFENINSTLTIEVIIIGAHPIPVAHLW